MSKLYELYKHVGNEHFGDEIGKIAPYFSTIDPEFVSLSPGQCELIVRNTRSVHNHIGTVHAIALCNGAELAAGLVTDISIPDNYRWIPVGMTVKYLALAKTDISIKVNANDIDWTAVGETVVPVEAFDTHDHLVFTAQITMKIDPKKESDQ